MLYSIAVVFQGSVLRVLPSTRSISSGCYREYWFITSYHKDEYTNTWYLRVLVLRVLRVLGVVPNFFNKRSILGVWIIFRPSVCAPPFRILLQTAFTVHGLSHEWELKKITFGGGNSSI